MKEMTWHFIPSWYSWLTNCFWYKHDNDVFGSGTIEILMNYATERLAQMSFKRYYLTS